MKCDRKICEKSLKPNKNNLLCIVVATERNSQVFTADSVASMQTG